MLIGRVNLSTVQKRIFRINYPWLRDGETVVSAVPTVEPNDGLFTVSDLIIGVDGDYVQFKASGNGVVEGGSEYTVSVVVDTSDGQTNDDCLEYQIEDCCP
ncbi:MAG: hypothetical protein DRP64_00075 [Verrucomicrobia bacterium]|nr:MAG: hypothetical protein DRP64_00075 [Verrucomicrobiota bacterium]RLA43535.1 MAG: hypothetical protein DRQ97_12655 [Gammaproteobacteria bacterium]